MMRRWHLGRLVWALGGLAVLLGFGREQLLGLIPKPRELPRFDGATGRPWVNEGFVPVGAMQEIAAGALPPRIQAVSSWLGTDLWQGRAESAWFKASRRIIHVGIAGYPQHAGCKVWAEFRNAAGGLTTVRCDLADPREQWLVWEIRRPSDAIAVRILAEDSATDLTGWVAFSHPFRAWPAIVVTAYQALQIFTTLALALTLLWGPGLLFCPQRAAPELRLVWLIGAGPLALASTGAAIWLLGGWVAPQILGGVIVSFGWTVLGMRLRDRMRLAALTAGESRVFALAALVVVAVVGKSFYSAGPQGELFRGTVSRNFEMADRIDSRYSFYIVQAVAHHWSPVASATEKLFAPWTFFSRGPLAGLTTTPIVMATNGRPAAEVPENRWVPFDAAGFAAYRIAMIALASTVILALFGVLVPFVGSGWATVAAGRFALSPFGVHEFMFTWPKWAATAWVVASFAFVHARRPLAGGVLLAIGFMFHPLALLWAPWLGLWALGRTDRSLRKLTAVGAQFALGAGLIVLPWMTIGHRAPHLESTPLPGQAGFLEYWKKADWQYATWDSWWHTRWMNFANTFVPLHVVLSEESYRHPKLSSAYETSPPVVRFSQVWWNTLPFGLGLGLWLTAGAALILGLRTLRAAVLLLVIGPALFITAYWGMDPLGLMRECGHPLFVTLIGLTCLVAVRAGGRLRALLQSRAFSLLQLPETWLMLWLTTFANPSAPAVDNTELDWLYLGLNIVALGAAAWLMARMRSDPALIAAAVTDRARHEPAKPVPWLEAVARTPAWVVLTVGAVILALRRPDQIVRPQFWAEDGIFFFQSHEMGVRAFFLELAGYSQLAPRIVATVSQLVDPRWAPHVFAAAGLATALYVMARTLSPRCPLPLKPWPALAVVLVPDAAEVLLNANNLQWLLAMGGVLLLISREPQTKAQQIHDGTAALLFGLTGPFSVMLAPFFIVRAVLRRSRASRILAALVGVCAVLQAMSIVLHPQPLPGHPTFDAAALAAFPGVRIAATAMVGAWQPASIPPLVGIALTLLLAIGLLALAARANETRPLRITLALLFAALLASALYRTWHSMPLMSVPGSASRYVFPLQLLLLWLLLTMAADGARAVRIGCAIAATWIILVNVPRLRVAPVPDKHWPEYAAKLRAGEEVTIPINPEGWTFSFPARRR